MIKTHWFEVDLNGVAALVTALTAAYLAIKGLNKTKRRKRDEK